MAVPWLNIMFLLFLFFYIVIIIIITVRNYVYIFMCVVWCDLVELCIYF